MVVEWIQVVVVLLLSVFAFGVEAWALIDAFTQKSGAFVSAGKLTKPLWLIILAVAAALGLLALTTAIAGGPLGTFNLLSIVAVVAAAVYLTDVRPAVRQLRGRGGSGRGGPYGPW
ncbi:MAG: DUF2516 family protein [Solirubrobacterales bacterium]